MVILKGRFTPFKGKIGQIWPNLANFSQILGQIVGQVFDLTLLKSIELKSWLKLGLLKRPIFGPFLTFGQIGLQLWLLPKLDLWLSFNQWSEVL